MTNLWPVRVAALSGFLAVGLGAFGAHGLKEVLFSHGMGGVWEKAVFYQLIHTVMLFLLGQRLSWPRGPWFCFLVGILFFSGSLYLLALTQVAWLGAFTPIGGVSFLAGWLWLLIAPGTQKLRLGSSSGPAGMEGN